MSTVTCSVCGTESETGKKFCAECGAALRLVCPTCGHEVTAVQKFCDECGTPLQREIPAGETQAGPHNQTIASSAPEERRLVTALFCDLVGFTPLSEQLDPEEVRDIQAAYFSAMSQQIERYGGVVEKYAGDAVLALFGAPVAHEDDAERAVLCAVGMQTAIEPLAGTARSRWHVEPRIRVGVNTGEVVSGTWDASGRQDVAVTGDALNTAARLQATADPGEVLVGTETMRLTRRRIRYGAKRDLVLKGKKDAIPAYPALDIREDVGERWEEAPQVSPLIGRDQELTMLLDAWARARGGEGQLLTLIGEPGVGKSRLVAEALEKISSSGSAIRIVRARCLSYGQEISLWLVADLLRSLFGIREQEGFEEVRMKLGAVVRSFLARSDETNRAEVTDVLGEVLGLPVGQSVVAQAGPQIRRQALLRSLRLLLGALSERGPTILVLGDLHWIDVASEEVIKDIVADVPGLRLLVLATQRPGWNAPWSEWGWTERMTLRPLREADATRLAGAVLGGTPLSAELERYVAERAGGNPFFVEEMLRGLEESGGLVAHDGVMQLAPGVAERLPSTLTEVLLARLDGLASQVKSVAQVGSVIGRNFAVRLLARVMGQEQTALELPLTDLQRAEIAFPRGGRDLEYVFKHVSMREVVYHTLVSRRKRELHLATARAIGSLYPADEYVEVIAYHYGKTDAPEAAEWLERAGDRAAAIYANESALTHFREAITRLQRRNFDPVAVARLEEKLGVVLYSAGRYDEALEMLGRAAETAREQRDLEASGRATARMGMVHRFRGTPDEGISLVQPMIDLLAWSGPSVALASLQTALASLYSISGRYPEMQEAAERAGEIARSIDDGRLLGEAEKRRGTAASFLGRPEEALNILQRAIPLVEAGGDLSVLYRAFNNAGVAAGRLGRMEEARRYYEQALDVAERVGNRDQIAFVLGNLGDTLLTLGEWERAGERLEHAMTVATASRTANATTPGINFGRLVLYQGRWEEAERILDEAVAVAEQVGGKFTNEFAGSIRAELEVLAGRPGAAIARLEEPARADDAYFLVFPVLAWALLEVGEVERAESVLDKALQRGRREELRLYLSDALRILGMIATRKGQMEQAERTFAEGIEMARSLPYPYAEGRFLHQLALLEQRRGDGERARRYLEEALAIFRRLGAQKDIEQCEETLDALDLPLDSAR